MSSSAGSGSFVQLCDLDGRGSCGSGGSITVAREVPLQEGEHTDSWEPGVALHHCRGSCGIGGSITGAREVPLHEVEHTEGEKFGDVLCCVTVKNFMEIMPHPDGMAFEQRDRDLQQAIEVCVHQSS